MFRVLSYWVFELFINPFNHIFHALKPSQDSILPKFIIHTKETGHLFSKLINCITKMIRTEFSCELNN